MEKLNKYGNIIERFLGGYIHENVNLPIEEHLIADKKHGHFQLMRTGWSESTLRIGIVIHIQLKPDAKVWILANWTEDDIPAELVELGIEKKDIVLGYLPQYARAYSGYATI